MSESLRAIVLAAGKGARMKTEGVDLPKVMRTANGKPLLSYVLDALSFVDKKNTCIVVGFKKEYVMSAYPGYAFAVQGEQLGTGHAVMSAGDFLKEPGPVLICCGDMPLIKEETYRELFSAHKDGKNICTMLTGPTSEPLPYGRIVRDESGAFLRIVEDRDCSPEERRITELNSGVYIFESGELLDALTHLKRSNSQGEYYLTDVPAILLSQGRKVGIYKKDLGHEILGVNTPEQLMRVEELLKGI